jgi:chaperone BCS1
MSNAKGLLTAAASVAATAMLIRSIANDFIPNEVRTIFFSAINKVSRKFSAKFTVVIDEYQGYSTNKVFEAVHAYLGTKVTPHVKRIKVNQGEEEKKLAVTVDRDEEIADIFEDKFAGNCFVQRLNLLVLHFVGVWMHCDG